MTALRTGSNPVDVEGDPQFVLRLRRMARELRLTDQILSFDLDCVRVVDSGPAPAWTSPDGSTITVNVGKMPGIRGRRGIAVWLGTNAHELFHNLFTPRSDALLMRRIMAAEKSTSSGIHHAWNILEDQRIERLGINRYAAWRGYLVAALAHHIPVTGPNAWLLVAGRTWLGDEARAIARAAFVATNDEGTADYAARLIGAYQRLGDPGDLDANEAYDIVTEFFHAFQMQMPPKGGCGGGTISEGEPEVTDDEDVSIPTADEADENDDDEGDGDEGESDDEYGDESDEGEGDGDSMGEPCDDGDESDEGDDGDGDDGESGDDGDDGDEGDGDESGDEPGEGGDAEGDGSDESDEGDEDGGDFDGRSDEGAEGDPGDGVSGPGERSMTEALDDAIDEALHEDDTKDDLDRVVDQLDHGAPGKGDLPKSVGRWEDVDSATRLLARDVSQILADIKDENEASWVRRTDSGRFSVDRWLTEDWSPDDVFDRFDAGQMDASSLDAVLVLDVSSSMHRQAQRLAQATWAIRTAIDRVEGTCTVIGFGDQATMIFDQGQRPDGRIFVPNLESSTVPAGACREAHRVVAGSDAANRIVIVLTDGDWWEAGKAGEALRACQSEGATVAIIGLGSMAARFVKPGFCGADVTAVINDSAELVPIFRDIAERSMLAAARRA